VSCQVRSKVPSKVVPCKVPRKMVAYKMVQNKVAPCKVARARARNLGMHAGVCPQRRLPQKCHCKPRRGRGTINERGGTPWNPGPEMGRIGAAASSPHGAERAVVLTRPL